MPRTDCVPRILSMHPLSPKFSGNRSSRDRRHPLSAPILERTQVPQPPTRSRPSMMHRICKRVPPPCPYQPRPLTATHPTSGWICSCSVGSRSSKLSIRPSNPTCIDWARIAPADSRSPSRTHCFRRANAFDRSFASWPAKPSVDTPTNLLPMPWLWK